MEIHILFKKFYGRNPLSKHKFPAIMKGFSAVEVIVVLGIIGILAALLYPSVMTTLEKRLLENTSRDIQTTLESAKVRAVKTRLNHRVTFQQVQGEWTFVIEEEDIGGNWSTVHGFPSKTIPDELDVTMNFPVDAVNVNINTVVFSSLGFVTNYNAAQNSITLTNQRMTEAALALQARAGGNVTIDETGQRIIMVFAGGAIQHKKQ